MSQPAVENAGVYVRDGLIHDVGPWSELSRRWAGEPIEDLGEVVLMPGLINAHCHLDYTGMAGLIQPPSLSAMIPTENLILAPFPAIARRKPSPLPGAITSSAFRSAAWNPALCFQMSMPNSV